mmetsp:Transcript_10461/g.21297  ORF Transcript_10461/g.21297 Transcript_10461/m.21297 type:complete len:472 (+) Transcript_10461:91-1506(+)
MNNQGLEALAALATAAPSSSNRGAGEAKRSGERAGSREPGTSASGGSENGSAREGQSQTQQSSQHGDRANPNASQLAQWQQLMSSLAAQGGGGSANPIASNPNLSFLSGLQQQNSQLDSSSLLAAMQNMAQYQMMAQAQAASQNQFSGLSSLAAQLARTNPQASGLGFGLQNPLSSLLKDTNHHHQHPDAGKAANTQSKTSHAGPKTSGATSHRTAAPPIAPLPPPTALDSYRIASDGDMSEGAPEVKREQKRAANRRSAQLSRKRKKQFIEELKDENDDLRRKEQILKSLPDLVVVFDSSGKLGFVSHSVDRLLTFTATELEGTSFWDRLCEESVRLLKAAFMDSLATREEGSDTAPLGTGVWELRLVDKDNTQKLVALNGVVHFAGDKPECVCTIRPRDKKSSASNDKNSKSSLPAVSIESHQSAISATERPLAAKKAKIGKSRDLVRISDSGNSTPESGDSESGSSDE